ncbi:MAG: CYTH domain-containing protein [Spirochaetales bacterium]|nr:CYTH domain-containing protein [Spirochaetales bacterium]
MKKKCNIAGMEVEIKLQLTGSVYNELKDISIDVSKKVFQKNYFFDSSTHILLLHKWILRIRIEDFSTQLKHDCSFKRYTQKGYMTVKGPGEIDNALHIRPEFESFIPVGQAESLLNGFDLCSVTLPPCMELINRFGDQHVVSFLCFDNLRTSFFWKEWKFELDKTEIAGQLFYELEVEINPGQRDILERELRELFQKHHWDYAPSPISKFKRALNLKNQ